MAKKTIAKPQRKVKIVVRVKSTDLTRCIQVVATHAAPGSPHQAEMTRAVAVLTAVLDGNKVKVVKSFDLETELSKFDNLPLECDGMTRVLSFKLSQMGVKHRTKQGPLMIDGQKVVPIHQWIELLDGRIVDYRARMWAGTAVSIPHGVFNPADFKNAQYVGMDINVSIDEKLFKILVTPIVPIPMPKADVTAPPAPPTSA